MGAMMGADHGGSAGTITNVAKARLALSAWAEMESLWSAQPNPTYKFTAYCYTELKDVCLCTCLSVSLCVSAFVGCAIKEIIWMLACECEEGNAFILLLNNTDCSVLS